MTEQIPATGYVDPTTGLPVSAAVATGQVAPVPVAAGAPLTPVRTAGDVSPRGAALVQGTPQAHATHRLATEVASATGGIDPMTGAPYTPHKAADDTEQIYFEGSPLIRGVIGRGIGWCLLGLVVIAIPVALYFLSRRHGSLAPWWLSLAIVVVGVVLFLVPVLKAKTVRYKISNYRIDFERGWLSKTIDTMELWHVEDLRFTQSFIDRLLGVGSITVLSHDDTTPKLILQGLPNPRPIFSALEQRVIAVKRQSGVIKTDSGV